MGKVPKPWVSQQKLLGDKLVTKLAELFEVIWNYLIISWVMSINFFILFFQITLWEMSINFYIRFYKNKIKKFIGLNSQLFGTILGNFSIFINLIYLFIFKLIMISSRFNLGPTLKTLIVAAMVTSLSLTQLLLRDPRLWYFTHSHEILKIKYKLKLEA